ncbi:unnamed protein product [Darwinula stevensoni]|uniref:C2H2-type domain-containing protein n=1 Tax=Darwinula stevensoni TaxID=69355 RepID=A0A7R8X1D7_9CRUS|nr:unnamed protein product [Darwinula stevensoni]CAG0880122.1 unnamed protein product [Darwinula stevensoni]
MEKLPAEVLEPRLKYTCEMCGRQFSHISNLNKHRNIHLGIKPFICQTCGKRFTQIGSLRYHLDMHEGKKMHQCSLCEETFENRIRLKNHVKRKHGSSPGLIPPAGRKKREFVCYICGKLFVARRELTMHEDQHQITRDLTCRACHKLFGSVEEAKSHNCSLNPTSPGPENFQQELVWSDLVENNFPLSPQDMGAFLSDFDLTNLKQDGTYLNIDLPQLCLPTQHEPDKDSCYQVDGPVEKRETVEILQHVDEAIERVVGRVCHQQHVCLVCNKPFSKPCFLERHLGTHDPSLRPFSCSQCGKSFSYRQLLQRHIHATHESRKQDDFYVCPVCHKAYLHKHTLKDHLSREHLKEKRYSCEECGKVFFKQDDLKKHLRIHSDDRPFICTVCGLMFRTSSHLLDHERRHQGQNTFNCKHCNAQYSTAFSLRKHLREKHSIISDKIYSRHKHKPPLHGTAETSH